MNHHAAILRSVSRFQIVGVLCCVVMTCVAGIRAGAQQTSGQARAARVDYNREVRPILAENCFICHGVDSNRRSAGLRLDKPEIAYGKLASGQVAIVPGDLKASELVARITATDGSQMPPASFTRKLTAAQIATLKHWIAQGAKYAPHWAYIPPKRPAIPAVKRAAWCLNPIDRFLLARLEQEGLKPSPQADPYTLIRRLSLDLTGLPPTPQQIEAFVHDTSQDAYARQVNRLLASPHYGERMAVYWLDLVRYADTVGYHGDQDVIVWPYRDYVIRAFNTNKRFDAFTREQLAGDLLPNASMETRVASGYNRLGMMSAEGGIQDKEYRAKYASDRVRNASAVWLGSTLGCAECHDHKYDPFSTKDFYRFEAFFADIKESGFYGGGGGGDWGPNLRLMTPAQKERLARFDADIAAARKTADSVPDAALADGRAKWEALLRARADAKTPGWTVATPTQAVSSGGATLTIRPDASVLASGKAPAFDIYTVTVPASLDSIASIRLETLGDDSLAGNGIARAGTYFVLSEFEVAVQRDGVITPVKLASVQVNDQSEGFPGTAMIDGRPETGWAQIYSDERAAVFHLVEPLRGGPNVQLIFRLRQTTKPHLTVGRFRLSLSSLAQADLSEQGVPANVLSALGKEAEKRTPAETQAILAFYRSVAPELETARQRLATLEGDRLLLLGAMPTTLVSESVAPRTMRVLPRGNWMDDSGEIVESGTPHFLQQVDHPGRATRLDLADWITSPQNPLTARVLVNRLWKLFFGVGLAKNVDDFGLQGEAPVHPELLDWLATEFMASGWDIQHMIRLMVTCNAYRQTSAVTPQGLARDPFNRLYARQSAFRMDAEFIHDLALDAGGLLVGRVGGDSAYPYQPRAYLAPLNFPRREWPADAGEGLYRRGLYTHWQRTFLHPSLLAFDAPTREEATCTRSISNTPMQALVLLNDTSFVEAARSFAARILRQGGKTLEQRLDFAYRIALSRPLNAKEIAILRGLYHSQRTRYAADREAATQLIATGDSPPATDLDPVELAAWTSVARAILNLHETITRS
jgi:mono/diheme cytochrome c family protein